jgi:hypothetical protein
MQNMYKLNILFIFTAANSIFARLMAGARQSQRRVILCPARVDSFAPLWP